MGMKLHRNRRVFRARRVLPRIIAWIIVAAAIMALGFFGAKYFTEHPVTPEDSGVSQPTESSAPSSTPSTSQPTTPQPPVSATTLRGFYLPLSATKNADTLNTTLTQAKDAGFTGVILDFKDDNGTLYYQSATPRATQANAFAADALTLEDTKALFTAIHSAGLQPVARLFAFKDNLGARALPLARVAHAENASWVWYDAKPANGGRAWLNPYADEAQLYILDLATELRDAGASAIMLDGVQFPANTSSANFGNTTVGRDEILTAFVDKARMRLGDSCPVMLTCTAQSALGNDTGVYGGNPLTFAPSAASPTLFTGDMPQSFTVGNETVLNTPDTQRTAIEALVNQLKTRIQVMSADKQPTLTPWLQAYDYTPAQVKAAMEGCMAGGATSYILYNPAGTYDFAALK